MKNCDCAKSDPTTCRGGRLERPRYFPRQLITPAEMNLGQDYFRQRLRLHNRMMHGWGVVCGALVCPTWGQGFEPEPWRVKVQRGYVLGPYGDEICIDSEHVVDLRTCGLSGAHGEPAGQSADPWCSEVYVKRDPSRPLCVAVKFEERMTRPIRAQPTGCGCDDDSCEYSRWCDGYVIGVLDECPEVTSGDLPDCSQLCTGLNPTCPPCPEDPWVRLAKVELEDDGTIKKIDNCWCRRLAVSHRDLWWQCQPGPFNVDDVSIRDRSGVVHDVVPGAELDVRVVGEGLEKVLRVDLGEGISLRMQSVEPDLLRLRAHLDDKASEGQRDLTITNSMGKQNVRPDVLKVVAATDDRSPARAAPRTQAAAEPEPPPKTRTRRPATKSAKAKKTPGEE